MLDARSEARLKDVHPKLAVVIRRASTMGGSFTVTEGLRTMKRQQELFDAGATRTMNSRHLTGHAVDIACLVNGKIRWDWPLYVIAASIVKQAAKSLDVPIEWGGDWKTFKDGPHFQLPFKQFPKGG